MSTGIFLSIGDSFASDAKVEAVSLVTAVNGALQGLGLEAIRDRPQGESTFGMRVGTDAIGSSTLARLGLIAGDGRAHAGLLAKNPYRLVYVPRDFEEPQATHFSVAYLDQEADVMVGSSARLLGDLRGVAAELTIPLAGDGSLGDGTAKTIDEALPLEAGEDRLEQWEALLNVRLAWLLLHEAALASLREDRPISLAG
jgi:hypothetical protein